MKPLIVFLLLIPRFSIGQSEFVPYQEVNFNSEFEKKTILKLVNNEEDYFNGFLSIAIEDSAFFEKWESFYRKEIEALKARKVNKNYAKDVKVVYQQLHDTFLRKYEILAFFDQIFENGTYNCVTAVALYSLAFEELGIPYSIKESPTHVYLVADPDDSQLLIETTDPVSGFKSFSPGFKEQYVMELALMKLVSSDDVNSRGIYTVFDEYYFGSKDISLKQLVGIHYYNKGTNYYNNREYHKAWNEFAKAQLLHSNKQIEQNLLGTLAMILNASEYKQWNDIALLPYLLKFGNSGIQKVEIIGEFNRMLNFVLTSRNDEPLAAKGFENFIDKSENQEINAEISFSYHYEVGRLAYNRAQYDKAFNSFLKSFEFKPGHAEVESLLLDTFTRTLRNVSTSRALTQLDSLGKVNPQLLTNNKFNGLQVNLLLLRMGEEFDEKRPKEGLLFKKKFEEFIDQNPLVQYDENIMGSAYSKAAIYYFRKGQTETARSIIKSGLKIHPENYELKSRLRMMNY